MPVLLFIGLGKTYRHLYCTFFFLSGRIRFFMRSTGGLFSLMQFTCKILSWGVNKNGEILQPMKQKWKENTTDIPVKTDLSLPARG